ncbi:LytTR family DNA-binding domain-containing protein [Aquimarina gracilis]|uniref:LytTR family DNA-binding domain-containing protein n=1 Tax=Aquimarina gracilis TaxID=874422 RepID=A0ABU6A1Z6_9FLAO|nr:LytTR family DNA-binding domain-containing protein [Aquimarina gracilis]MEB3348111.1 LytTR family DNA-binding domain-containing protein [Aquimarina gracilis]
MNTISCFIVEDDPQAYEYAHSIVKEYGKIDIIGNSDSIHKAADLVKRLRPNFIILDVFLVDGNAFEFLELFETIDFKIIFTTSFAKYALEAFKFSALDYLLKPYSEEELIGALDKVSEDIHKANYQLQLQTLLQNLSTKEAPKKIVLKNADAMHIIKTDDIVYAKADNNYTRFTLSHNKEILVSKPLKSFDEKLTPYNFFRAHQSFLINLSHISSFNKRTEEVILIENHTIPVAQSRKKKLIDLIENQS